MSYSPSGSPAHTTAGRPLADATSTAAGEASEALTTRSGRSSLKANATAPDPVPTS